MMDAVERLLMTVYKVLALVDEAAPDVAVCRDRKERTGITYGADPDLLEQQLDAIKAHARLLVSRLGDEVFGHLRDGEDLSRQEPWDAGMHDPSTGKATRGEA